MKLPFVLTWSLVIAIVAGCSKSAEPNAQAGDPKVEGQSIQFPANSPQLTLLGVAEAKSAPAPVSRFAGRIVWDDNVTTRIYSPFGGRVIQLLTDVGDLVTTNTTLALLASPDFGQAQAEARRAVSDYELAERAEVRVRELFEHGAAAQKDWQAAQADFARAKSERQRAESRMQFYGNSNSALVDQLLHLTSPLAGMVVERNVTPGQEVRADAMLANSDKLSAPLLVVTDPSQVWALVDFSEQDLSLVRPGQGITLRSRAFPNETFSGVIEKVANALDLATRMVRVRATVANPNRHLKSEMLVSVEFNDVQASGIEVPANSVFLKGETHFLYREEAPGRFSRQPVKLGAEHGGKIVVLEGLKAGERVVSDGCLLLEQIYEGVSES